jgi:hypothetical protein
MALAITDDHAAQESAFYESPQWQRSPDALREHLTHEEIAASGSAGAARDDAEIVPKCPAHQRFTCGGLIHTGSDMDAFLVDSRRL